MYTRMATSFSLRHILRPRSKNGTEGRLNRRPAAVRANDYPAGTGKGNEGRGEALFARRVNYNLCGKCYVGIHKTDKAEK